MESEKYIALKILANLSLKRMNKHHATNNDPHGLIKNNITNVKPIIEKLALIKNLIVQFQ